MNSIINDSDLVNIIKKSDKLMEIAFEPLKIQLINDSDNKTFKIEGKQTIFAKVGLAGWGKYEFEILKKLSRNGYDVPEPITFIPLQTRLIKDLSFGDLRRDAGILFFYPLVGKSLEQYLTKINIRNALHYLKKLHEDRSLSNGIIEKYQEVEVKRGLGYIEKLFNGQMAEKLQELMKIYERIEINFCFIHGGPRLEHFIIKNNQMGMIDFEGACIGDPFKDLGIFFTELLFHDIDKKDLIRDYFNRDLTKEEKIRLRFFELRALLVKKTFESNQDILKYIHNLI